MNITRIKYPRTPHLPWSPGATIDDTRCTDSSFFEGKQVVITEKLDGENTTLYNDYLHPRAIDSRSHSSRDWVKALHASIAASIPKNWRICGENLYARHSIGYEQLDSFFYVFSIWNEKNWCIDWIDTIEWISLLELNHPRILYEGLWNEKLVRSLSIDTTIMEGYVVRTAQGFSYENFATHCAKWVRQGHVQSEEHWMSQILIPNKLKLEK